VSRRERDKGRRGEAEVAAIFREAGLAVRGLEATGDHVVASAGAGRVRLHSEVKRQETARPWQWWRQAEAETEPGSATVVAFRRNRSPWLAMIRLDVLALLVAAAGESVGSDRRLLELDRRL
jgi:sensor domain CHASE-containing protein